MCKLFLLFEPVWTVTAIIPATVTALFMVGSRENHKSFFGKVIIFIGQSGKFLLLLLGFGHLVALRYIE